MKKLLAIFLSLAMIFSLVSMPTLIASADLKPGDGGTVGQETDDFDDTLAQTVIDMINALGEITSLDQKPEVVAARTAYDALSPDQKPFVTADILKKLTDAEAEIKRLEDAEAALRVDQMIDALGEITTLTQKPAVVAARQAYDALTFDQKNLISNLAKLELAEAQVVLLESFEQAVLALGGLENAISLADASAKFSAVRSTYEALTANQQAAVPTETMDKIEAYGTLLKEITDVVADINALNVTAPVKDDVEAARAAYEDLSDIQKGLVPADVLKKLEDAEDALNPKIPGDLDGDKKVDVSDVIMLRNWIMEGNPTPERLTKGDLDKDGKIDVSDVIKLRNIIMGTDDD